MVWSLQSHCVKFPGHSPWELQKQTLCCLSCSLVISCYFCYNWFLSQLVQQCSRKLLWTNDSLLITGTTCMRIQTPSNTMWAPSEAHPVHTKLRQVQTLTTPEVKEEATSPGEPPASASPQPQAAYVYGYIVFYSLIYIVLYSLTVYSLI